MKLSKIISIKKSRQDKVYDIHHNIEEKNFYDDHPNLITNNKIISNCGRHAGGICIGDDLTYDMPLISSKGVMQTPWSEGQNVRHLEPLGFIKFDILGIDTLNMISDCIKRVIQREQNKENVSFEEIKAWYIEHLDPSNNNFDDKDVYENVFHAGRWPGIFQFTKPDAQSFCSKAKPYSIADLSAITSIYRPGPISANVHNEYVRAKNDKEENKFMKDQRIRSILAETSGFLIYQEQIASLTSLLGKDISLNEGNYLRKLLTKKGTGKGLDKIESIKIKFLEGAKEKGLTGSMANELWENMENFATYGFNKCLDGERTFVTTKESGEKKIKDVQVGEHVLSKNGFVKVLDVMNQGKKKVIKFVLETGKTLFLTKDHKIDTNLGMKTAAQIIDEKLSATILTNNKYEKIVLYSKLSDEQDVETYDLEVDSDDHTFFANGISVSNSHAVSYSVVSYQCAYLFTKYPNEWIMAYLDKTSEEEKEEAINIVKGLGYEIRPVSITHSKNEWTMDDNGKLIQPFTFIKGLGDKAIEQIYLGRPFSTIEDLIFNDKMTYSKFNKKALDVLIRSGALSDLMDDRFTGQKHLWRAVAEDRPKTLKAFNENIEKYKDEGDFSLEEKIEFTLTLTGTYPFDLVVDQKTLSTLKKCDINSISDFDYENPFVWFLVTDKAEKTTRNGKKYTILTVTDLTNKVVEVKCWHETGSIQKHAVYLSKLNHDEWGFSSRSEKNFKKI